MRPGFAPFDFSLPLDLEALLHKIPPGAGQRGMFLQGFLDEAKKQGKPLPGERHYTSFKEYSSLEGYRLCGEVAAHLYPDVSLREGFRRLGHTVYPSLLGSMVGRALFGIIGKKTSTLMGLIPKGYSVSTQEVKAELIEVTQQYALLKFTSFEDFDPSLDIGIVEGVALFCEKTPRCLVKRSSRTEVAVLCSWT
jgi:uncharacterized protein (TIGR02265 family)